MVSRGFWQGHIGAGGADHVGQCHLSATAVVPCDTRDQRGSVPLRLMIIFLCCYFSNTRLQAGSGPVLEICITLATGPRLGRAHVEHIVCIGVRRIPRTQTPEQNGSAPRLALRWTRYETCPSDHFPWTVAACPPRLKDIPDRAQVFLIQRLVGSKMPRVDDGLVRVHKRLQREDGQRLLDLRQHVPALLHHHASRARRSFMTAARICS
jgi:hypothetical protein